MEQLSKEQAMAFAKNKLYTAMTDRKKAEFQLLQDRLCMPFSVFHEAIEATLERPVYTHEFGLNREGLLDELCGEGHASTLEEIINMIPAEKQIIVAVT